MDFFVAGKRRELGDVGRAMAQFSLAKN